MLFREINEFWKILLMDNMQPNVSEPSGAINILEL